MTRSRRRAPSPRGSSSGGAPLSQLRLIGGTWRSRKLSFREIPGLRPTPDRVRETLFNWLAPIIPGARCLDLFAGSGALGLEALSRGARETWFVEAHGETAANLRANLAILQSSAGQVWTGDALAFLAQPGTPFDVIFLDPPFRQGWLDRVIPLLEDGRWLAPGARIYLEYEQEHPPTALPPHWRTLREKEAGQLRYHLLQVEAELDQAGA